MNSSLAYWICLTLKTRKYGSTYVHTANRCGQIEINNITFRHCSFGRSLQYGGHKYKVYAEKTENQFHLKN